MDKLIKIFIAFLLLLAVLSLKSQDGGISFGLSSGTSIPFGKYSSTEYGEGSFTQPGLAISGDFSWFFSSKFGIFLRGSYLLHPIDVSALGLARVNKDPFLSNVIIRSEPYKILTIMPGVGTKLKLSEKWNFNAGVMAGYLWGQTPYQLHKPDYYLLPDDWEEITSARDSKFSWKIAAGIEYELLSCVGFFADAELLNDTLKFDFITSTGTRTDEKHIAVVNLKLGFRIHFNQ